MLIEIILSIAIGVLLGTFTGLVPGIHINLVGIILISLSTGLLLAVEPIFLVVFIVAMSITHTFIDFIPAIFLGCPESGTELSTLPGHDLLKQGKGYEAVLLSIYGSLFAILILMIISYPSMILFPKIYNLTRNILPHILIIISIILILMENRKLTSLIVFSLTGILGYFVLNFESLNQPFLPLLTGLFGSSMLILSIKNKIQIPKQNTSKIKFNIKKFLKPLTGSLVASPLCSFLPGLGAGQAAIVGSSIIKTDGRGFIVLLGATNTLVMGFSFLTYYLFSKTRTGSVVAIQEIFGTINTPIIILILITMLISAFIAFNLSKSLAKISSEYISKINYIRTSLIILILITLITLIVSGVKGVLVLIVSTLTGIYCINLGVRKTLMMGCLLIPTIILSLG